MKMKTSHRRGQTRFQRGREDLRNFHIGGYQVCEKWLKDRKSRQLSSARCTRYQKIDVALSEAICLIKRDGRWPMKRFCKQLNQNKSIIMNPRYYDIYNELHYAYRSNFFLLRFDMPFSPWLPEQIIQLERTISEMEEKLKKPLRPDAKLFLLSNFHLMVLLPVNHPLAPQGAAENIQDAVHSDIRTIIWAAAEYNKIDQEISGGAILRVTADLWKELKTNAQNIWT